MNYIQIALHLANIGLQVFACRIWLKSYLHPLFVVIIWWSVWLSLAVIFPITETPIDLKTQFLFLLFINVFYYTGVFLNGRAHATTLDVRGLPVLSPKILRRILAVVFLVSLFLGYRGYNLGKVYLTEYRELSYGVGDYSSLLYGSYYVQRLAELLFAPLVLACQIAVTCAGIFHNKIKYIFAGLALSIAVSFQNAGRFALYYYLIIVISAVLVTKRGRSALLLRLLPVFAILGITYVVITAQRFGATEIEENLVVSSVEHAYFYHVVGFSLLNNQFTNPESVLHKGNSYGRVSLLAYPDTIVCMLLRRIGVMATPAIDDMAVEWQAPVFLGYDKNSSSVTANAFYTILYPLYYDMGIFGIIFMPILFTRYFVFYYKMYERESSFIGLCVITFLMLFVITSIFNSKISSNDFAILLYIAVGLKLFREIALKPMRGPIHRIGNRSA